MSLYIIIIYIYISLLFFDVFVVEKLSRLLMLSPRKRGSLGACWPLRKGDTTGSLAPKAGPICVGKRKTVGDVFLVYESSVGSENHEKTSCILCKFLLE